MKTMGRIVVMLMGFAMIAVSCKKDDAGTAKMYVRMKDAPGDFQQVNVDIIGVDVHYSSDTTGNAGWVSLPTNVGIYDLLELQNDISVILTDTTGIPVGSVTQMRLILGENNSVMVDSVIYDLATPSAQNTGLKFNLNTTFLPDEMYEVLIDFDAQKSIVIHGNGTYSLKPVIKVEDVIQL